MTQRAGSKAEYARLRGWSKAYLSKADVKERLAPAEFVDPNDGKKKIDFDKADEIFAQTSDPARNKAAASAEQDMPSETSTDTGNPAGGGFHNIKTSREALKLHNETLDYEERRGSLIRMDETINAMTNAGKILQERLKSRNKRIAEQIQTISDPLVIKTKLDESDREILKEISDALAERIFRPSGGPVSSH